MDSAPFARVVRSRNRRTPPVCLLSRSNNSNETHSSPSRERFPDSLLGGPDWIREISPFGESSPIVAISSPVRRPRSRSGGLSTGRERGRRSLRRSKAGEPFDGGDTARRRDRWCPPRRTPQILPVEPPPSPRCGGSSPDPQRLICRRLPVPPSPIAAISPISPVCAIAAGARTGVAPVRVSFHSSHPAISGTISRSNSAFPTK